MSVLKRGLRHCAFAIVLYVGLLALTGFGFKKVPTGFVPSQDRGSLIAYLQLPDASSLPRTQAVSDRVQKILMGVPGVEHVNQLTGFSAITLGNNTNSASMFISLKPFDERKKTGLTADRIMKIARKRLSVVNDGFVGVFGLPSIEGLGSLGGFKMQIQDRKSLGFDVLESSAMNLMMAANQDKRISGALTTLRAGVPRRFWM